MDISLLDEDPPAARVTAPVLVARDVASRAVGRGYSVSWRDVDGATDTTLTLRPARPMAAEDLRREVESFCTRA